jgi:hypothetical protein
VTVADHQIVRVRDHILLSTAAAALLAPSLGLDAAGFWAGGVLVDVDHYLWFCISHRHLSPRAAARFFNGAHPAQASATRALHHPLGVAAVLALAVRRQQVRPLALGLSLHVGLDARHEARMNRARAKALARDRHSCRACGVQTPHVGTHLVRQPWLLPDYGTRNVVSLCGRCHEAAHARPRELRTWS